MKTRNKWRYANKENDKLFDDQSLIQIHKLRDDVMCSTWSKEVEDKSKKVNWLTSRTEKGTPGVIEGVVIDDKMLTEKFGDQEPSEVIYGDIDPPPVVKKFLRIQPGFRLFPKLDITDIKVELESTAAKQRWGHRDLRTHGTETVDELRTRKDKESIARKIVKDKVVNFTDARPTDLKFNKYINLPEPAEGEAETTIQIQKLVSLSIVKQFMENKCI